MMSQHIPESQDLKKIHLMKMEINQMKMIHKLKMYYLKMKDILDKKTFVDFINNVLYNNVIETK